jgi:nucleotide-binding universal stress UspA family protein
MLKNVLITLDGSELAESALPYARKIVAPSGTLTLLSIVDVPEPGIYSLYEVPTVATPGNFDEYISELKTAAYEYLEQVAKPLRQTGLHVETVVEIGEPAVVILDEAKRRDVNAIVMSTHGRSGLQRWLFGSVTQKVLAGMHCPVFVVPGRETARDSKQQTAFDKPATVS